MKEKKEKALLHISEITSPSFVPSPSPGSGDSPHPFIKCRTFFLPLSFLPSYPLSHLVCGLAPSLVAAAAEIDVGTRGHNSPGMKEILPPPPGERGGKRHFTAPPQRETPSPLLRRDDNISGSPFLPPSCLGIVAGACQRRERERERALSLRTRKPKADLRGVRGEGRRRRRQIDAKEVFVFLPPSLRECWWSERAMNERSAATLG